AAIPRFSSDGRWLGCHWRGGEQVQLLEVTACSEYRTIVSSWGAGRGAYHDGAISPDGRLLALGMAGGGDRLWDLGSGRELATLPSKSQCVLFEPDGQALITCGVTGPQRWPIQNGARDDEFSLGPPRMISMSVVPNRAACTPDGKTLAVVSEMAGAGLVVDLATQTVHGGPLAHARACFVAFSLDGQLVASSGWHSDRVRLWNAKSGKMIHEWVLGTMSRVSFTPDNRFLIISRGDAYTFWDVQTLQPIRRLEMDVALYPGRVAFTFDGKLMAMEMAPGVIHLKEVATARTVAKLEDPHGDRAGWIDFTPDGTQLVVAATYAMAIHVWDLRAIRERLKVIGLDWNWPEFPPVEPKTRGSALVKVKVFAGDKEQPIPTPEEKAVQAIEHYRLEIKKQPDNAAACNSLAWLYLTAPAALRDLDAAIPLAEKAVRLAPENAHYRNTLGVAYYRAGRFQDAVGKLEQNLTRQDDKGLAFDLYFLAMSHHQLGETARARDYYTWAMRWTAAQPSLSAAEREELTAFRAEAEEVLGIEKKK
ncbi:MAG TPA: hypothetical protein VE988_00670, partial [Gemmataceae bacterium]|nr:hypothetical protein [Gemmataceae bacterium]